MSEEIKSKPGKGILSPPGKSKVSLVSQNGWPTRHKAVEIIAKQQLTLCKQHRLILILKIKTNSR